MSTRRTTIAAATVVVLLLAGCSSAATPSDRSSAAAPTGYLCGGVAIPAEALAARVPLAETRAETRRAFEVATWDDGRGLGLLPDEGWALAHESAELIALFRDAPGLEDPGSPETAAGSEVAVVMRAASMAGGGPEWFVSQRSACALQVDLGDLEVPDVALASTPDPASRDIELLVTERGCASGRTAEGRIEVVDLRQDVDQVVVTLGVRPFPGAQDCQGNDSTPFTLALDEPLGSRPLLDAGFAEPRAVPTRG
ncbi:hypothetical protein [Clavibacter californiensis]|uniref:Lipoprotein n=1 Tax=Clavibacter californiensis TaxID=1401995 RepID=A0ABX9N5M4_9MICO|nr:hypothetical protein [Clavibacter californiensis]RII91684.1 hypothetical protein DZF98_08905 [Clavibacter californiensis]UKF81153.1 hypothetical protein FGD68_05730 [Clavibacter californiensis]